MRKSLFLAIMAASQRPLNGLGDLDATVEYEGKSVGCRNGL